MILFSLLLLLEHDFLMGLCLPRFLSFLSLCKTPFLYFVFLISNSEVLEISKKQWKWTLEQKQWYRCPCQIFHSCRRNDFCFWVQVLRPGVRVESRGQSCPPVLQTVRREEVWDIWQQNGGWDTEKLRFTVSRYGMNPASGYQVLSMSTGKLCVFQQCLVVQWWCELHCFCVRHILLSWCLTFSLICIRIHVGDLVKNLDHEFFFFLKGGREGYPNAPEALICPEPQYISSSLRLVSEV